MTQKIMDGNLLSINNLHVSTEGKEIIAGLNLNIRQGEVHALMGKNGSGKTTLSYTIMGHPKYTITNGNIKFEGEDINSLTPDQRAKKKIFLAFQYPITVPGVSVANFLRNSFQAVRGDEPDKPNFRKLAREKLKELDIPESFMSRYLNDGFSGGEKKRLEILQMALLNPKIMILDETDSGLDIDALKTIANGIEKMRTESRAILLITHYQRMLQYIQPDFVHILADGKIVRSGGYELGIELDKKGYEHILQV
ncbi:MAG: Fe-S cluster assembly ATPase SufC [Nitrospinota bacterium]